jgi:hypothetical protein
MAELLLLAETDASSRSKQAGPCWVAVTGTYATPGGKTVAADVGARLTVTGRGCRWGGPAATWTCNVAARPCWSLVRRPTW